MQLFVDQKQTSLIDEHNIPLNIKRQQRREISFVYWVSHQHCLKKGNISLGINKNSSWRNALGIAWEHGRQTHIAQAQVEHGHALKA
jgi:hypothetical protein